MILKLLYLVLAVHALTSSLQEFERFEKAVDSLNFRAECDARKGDERGPFGIVLKEGKVTHDLLVMTGVYYETCKDLEKRINQLRKRHSKLILGGAQGSVSEHDPNNQVWTWRSVQTLDRKTCISYFKHDCE